MPKIIKTFFLLGRLSLIFATYNIFKGIISLKNVVFNKNAQSIKISYVIGMIGELDLSSVETLNINNTNLSGISKIKLNPEGQIFMDEQSFNSAKNLIQQYKNIKIR